MIKKSLTSFFSSRSHEFWNIEEYISDHNNKLIEKTGYNLSVLFIDKKHSSGRIKSGIVELRISKNLPHFIKVKHIESLISKLTPKLSKMNQNLGKDKIREFLNCISKGFCIVNSTKITIIKNSTKTTFKIDKNLFEIQIPNLNYETMSLEELERIEKKCGKLICELFTGEVKEIVYSLNKKSLNSKLGEISLNYTSSKWGHCTGKDDIMINIALLNAPLWVLEYVIYHELAHTIHKNHSSKYWSVCNSLTPHTKSARIFLRHSPQIIWESNLENDIKNN